MYTDFFPLLKTRRVDVTDDLIRVYCSITTTSESETPVWLADEEFSNFIKFFFYVWIEEIPENFTGRKYAEVFAGDVSDSFYRWPIGRRMDPGFDPLAFERERRTILKVEHTITMEEVKQQAVEFIEGISSTQEYGTTETLFQVEIPIPSTEQFVADGQITRESPISETSMNLVSFSHLDVEEFMAHHNITSGRDEVRRLGGNSVYDELVDTINGRPTVNPASIEKVSYSSVNSSDPFIGFYDSHLFSTDRSPGIAPGTPDVLSWKSNTDIQSFFSGLRTNIVSLEEIKKRKIKAAAIGSVRDGNSCRLSENCWITLNGDEKHYNYHFVLDMFSIVKNHSPLGFLLNEDPSNDVGISKKRAFIKRAMKETRIVSLSTTRRRVENIPNVTSRAGTLIRENHEPESHPASIFSSDTRLADSSYRLNPVKIDNVMSLEELTTDLSNRKSVIATTARTFLLKDEHFFTSVTDGKYKYFCDLRIEDGLVRIMSSVLSELKSSLTFAKSILLRLETLGESAFDSSYDEADLLSAISTYTEYLAVLGLVPLQYGTLTRFRDELLIETSPRRLGNFDNVNRFVKNLSNLQKEYIALLAGAGITTDPGTGIVGEVSLEKAVAKNGEKHPSNSNSLLYEVTMESEKVLSAFDGNSVFADYGEMSLPSSASSTSPIVFIPTRYVTLSSPDNIVEILNYSDVAMANMTGTDEEKNEIRDRLMALEYTLRQHRLGRVSNYNSSVSAQTTLGDVAPGLSLYSPRLLAEQEGLAETSISFSDFESNLIKASYTETTEEEFLRSTDQNNNSDIALRNTLDRGTYDKIINVLTSLRSTAATLSGDRYQTNLEDLKDKYFGNAGYIAQFLSFVARGEYEVIFKKEIRPEQLNNASKTFFLETYSDSATGRMYHGAIPVNNVRLGT